MEEVSEEEDSDISSSKEQRKKLKQMIMPHLRLRDRSASARVSENVTPRTEFFTENF